MNLRWRLLNGWIHYPKKPLVASVLLITVSVFIFLSPSQAQTTTSGSTFTKNGSSPPEHQTQSNNPKKGGTSPATHPAIAKSSSAPTPPPSSPNTTVDFRQDIQPLNTYSVGATISTYSGSGQANINRSAIWKSDLQALGPLAWRIPLRYNSGNPGSSAGGGQSSGDAATYIQNIKAMGGDPVVVMGGDTSDNNFTSSDAANLVHYFNDNGGQHGGPVHAWVIGNEYTNPGNDPFGYQLHLAGWASSMKGADPTITLSAPAAPDMKYADTAINDSVKNAAPYIDYLSYHAYQGASAGLAATGDYEYYAHYYISKYATAANFGSRASSVHSALEEFNWAPYYNNNPEFYDWHNTVFIASVIGNSLTGSAHAYMYADSNGALGLMNDGSGQNNQPGSLYTKFPAYWGLAMWTGMNGEFKRFGNNLVKTTSSVANVEIYATDNGKILAINKDGAKSASITIGTSGYTSSSYDVWQTNESQPLAAPTKVTSNASFSGATISLSLPAGTVSSIDLK